MTTVAAVTPLADETLQLTAQLHELGEDTTEAMNDLTCGGHVETVLALLLACHNLEELKRTALALHWMGFRQQDAQAVAHCDGAVADMTVSVVRSVLSAFGPLSAALRELHRHSLLPSEHVSAKVLLGWSCRLQQRGWKCRLARTSPWAARKRSIYASLVLSAIGEKAIGGTESANRKEFKAATRATEKQLSKVLSNFQTASLRASALRSSRD